jgi:integrase
MAKKRQPRRSEPLTDAEIRALETPRRKPYLLRSAGLPSGLSVRLYKSGLRRFMAKTVVPGKLTKKGNPVVRWNVIGDVDSMTVAEAGIEARARIVRIRKGLPAEAPPPVQPNSLRQMAAEWMKQEGQHQLRRAEKQRRLDVYLLPRLGDVLFESITKLDLALALDQIVEDHGARQADMVKVDIQAIARWHAERSPTYSNPFRDLRRRSRAKPRSRVFTHDELRIIWRVASMPEAGMFGALVRLALLSCQRRKDLISMRHDDVNLTTGEWRIPRYHDDEKGTPAVLTLPPTALEIVAAQPRTDPTWIFPARHGGGHVSAIGTLKQGFDELLAGELEEGESVAPWTPHDCRRSARTWLSEIGIADRTAESIMGHKPPGIVGNYDYAKLVKPMAVALMALEQYIETVLAGGGNVVPFAARS